MESRNKIANIKALYLQGKITFDEAKKQVQPILEKMNAKGKEIAKEHGMKFKPFTFTGVFR
jgi:polyhydroxyalkanoate synthesis regulator phasin